MSNFSFLAAEWPDVHEAACKAEAAVYVDPRAACFYARYTLERMVTWAFKADASLRMPYQDSLSAMVHEPSFKQQLGPAVFAKMRVVITLGNQAVHHGRPIQSVNAEQVVSELFHVGYWFARTYARQNRPAPGLCYDPVLVPRGTPVPKQTQAQLKALEASLEARDRALAEALEKSAALDAELKRLHAEIAQAKQEAAREPDTHDYNEAQTRVLLIDELLREAGWALDQARDREFPVAGMPKGEGRVDYVLWGDDGKPLGIVEAKRSKVSAQLGQQQAKLYADCLEAQFGQRPLIFGSNGYEHWLWDDTQYPKRDVQGFYTKDELERLVQRRRSKRSLADTAINPEIAGRHYQTHAIRRIGEEFEDRERKALVVMATGSGKTRTVIALCDQLIRANWAMRILFLADRKALVRQAVNAFKTHLPDASPVNLVTERTSNGRIYASTYPTMMGLINKPTAERRFGVGYFDLIVIDEAHRSVYQKYRAIFEYFDALLVGLTATPKEEIDKNTYGLFDLETGVPTDAYTLDAAVADGFLVRPKSVSVPLKFVREGVKYADLSQADKEAWDELEWQDEEKTRDHVEAEAVNKWLFNADTVDKVLAHLMTHGTHVAGGDVLGKTIIFAKNQQHAEFIAERFDANYPHYKGAFARVIHCDLPYAESLIDDFSDAKKLPQIAISVDMLDTGIDVPEVVNLVFFKLVRSPTKFWQMLGRGTRLKPDLFGPGQHKEYFNVFDFCMNLEFFKQQVEVSEGALGQSLGKRLFKLRLELMGELDRVLTEEKAPALPLRDKDPQGYGLTPASLRGEVAGLLQREVAAMNQDNFVVRPKRKLVSKYAEAEAWGALSDAERNQLGEELAGLPSELESDGEDAKRFDLLLLKLQLGVLRKDTKIVRLQEQVQDIASALELKANIPLVQAQLATIQDVQTGEFWQDVTVTMLEDVRKRLRSLVRLIDKQKRTPIYTNFEDELGEVTLVELPGLAEPIGFERFRLKMRAFLRVREDHITIHKLRMNRPLTKADLDELERMLLEGGQGHQEDLKQAIADSQGIGLFVRSLVGLAREAAKVEIAKFSQGKNLTSRQLDFLNLVTDHLTKHGLMSADLLYESPFTDVAPTGPDDLFEPPHLTELLQMLEQVRASALAG